MKINSSPLALALLAYACWGFVPAYWKQIPAFSAWELILWRVVFSALALLPALAWRREFPSLFALLRAPRSAFALIGTSCLIGFNWSLYIWAVTSGHIVESALGYFLNPLLNVALGTFLLKERMSFQQKLACLLASLGVAWLTWSAGQLPWIALLLAFSFAAYGLGRKLARLPTLPATTAETLILAPPAAFGLVWLHAHGGLHASVAGPGEWAWLSLSGPVTAIPLLAFAEAAVHLPLTVMGFVQFVSPSLQFLLGVLVYREPFSLEKAAGFALIWAGLAFFVVDLARRRARRAA